MSDEKILSKIAAALALAENASTPQEAEAAMAAAQRLGSAYSIDLATARMHQAGKTRRATPTHRTIVLGEAGKRGLHTFVNLFFEIARPNGLKVNVAHNSTYVIAFGFDEDVALVEALYAGLVVQMVKASAAYVKAGTFRDEQVIRRVTKRDRRNRPYTTWDHAPVTPQMARANFQQAFAARIGARLDEAQQQARDAAVAAERAAAPAAGQAEQPPARTGTELALIAKDVEIAEYYQGVSTARGSWRGGRAQGEASRDARQAGDKAGRRARIGSAREVGGGSKQIAS